MTDTTYITPSGIECRMLDTDVVEMKFEEVRDSATIRRTVGGFSITPEFGHPEPFDSMADAMVFAEQGLLKVKAEAEAKAAEAEAVRQRALTQAEVNFAEGIARLGATPTADVFGELI